ncbi:MAG: aspartate/glutamate racemase family protein [Clostridia bacterium]|nr:aspartate/glutamate racemase family protein [Clostridia bacterium]
MENSRYKGLKIAIADSGAGGLNLLKKLFYTLPANYVYFADGKNFPYGNKTARQLFQIGKQIVERYDDVDAIVFACNTMSQNCLSALQTAFPQKRIIGCTPPVNQASTYTANNFVLLATPSTISATKRLPYSAVPVPCYDLATLVENNAKDVELLEHLEGLLSAVDKPFDCIVLGCTHFSVLKTLLYRLYPAIKIFDSVDGVANRIKKTFKNRTNWQTATSFVRFESFDDSLLEKYSKIISQFTDFP